MNEEDSPVLHNRLIIASDLALLAKERCTLSADLGGKNTFLTSIIKVDQKKDILILDMSSSEKLNEMCIKSQRVQFNTVYNGIKIAFSSEKITKTKHEGYDAFLMTIPKSLYWLNRRGTYRVRIPSIHFASCKIVVPTPPEDAKPEQIAQFNQLTSIIRQRLKDKIEQDLFIELQQLEKSYLKMTSEQKVTARVERNKLEKAREENPVVPDENLVSTLELRLIDLSMSGCAIMNNSREYSPFLTAGTRYENCALTFPEHGDAIVDLEVMMQHETEDYDDRLHDYHEFIGVKFTKTSLEAESSIFRYIQAMDRLMKNRREFV
jgi:c-di-GMP-binding flagellar brake protein YcgR